jgi:hypothetical protein
MKSFDEIYEASGFHESQRETTRRGWIMAFRELTDGQVVNVVDLRPAQCEGRARDALIAMGWTPPRAIAGDAGVTDLPFKQLDLDEKLYRMRKAVDVGPAFGLAPDLIEGQGGTNGELAERRVRTFQQRGHVVIMESTPTGMPHHYETEGPLVVRLKRQPMTDRERAALRAAAEAAKMTEQEALDILDGEAPGVVEQTIDGKVTIYRKE